MELVSLNETNFCEAMEAYQDGLDSHICTFNTIVPTYEDWDKSHLPFGRIGVSHKGKVVGFGCLSYFSKAGYYKGVLEVSIYVKNEYQGLGIGKMIMEELISISEKNNCWTLVAHIIANNSKSIAFHSKMGFRMVGYREKLAKNYEGIWLDTVLMERRSPIVL